MCAADITGHSTALSAHAKKSKTAMKRRVSFAGSNEIRFFNKEGNEENDENGEEEEIDADLVSALVDPENVNKENPTLNLDPATQKKTILKKRSRGSLPPASDQLPQKRSVEPAQDEKLGSRKKARLSGTDGSAEVSQPVSGPRKRSIGTANQNSAFFQQTKTDCVIVESKPLESTLTHALLESEGIIAQEEDSDMFLLRTIERENTKASSPSLSSGRSVEEENIIENFTDCLEEVLASTKTQGQSSGINFTEEEMHEVNMLSAPSVVSSKKTFQSDFGGQRKNKSRLSNTMSFFTSLTDGDLDEGELKQGVTDTELSSSPILSAPDQRTSGEVVETSKENKSSLPSQSSQRFSSLAPHYFNHQMVLKPTYRPSRMSISINEVFDLLDISEQKETLLLQPSQQTLTNTAVNGKSRYSIPRLAENLQRPSLSSLKREQQQQQQQQTETEKPEFEVGSVAAIHQIAQNITNGITSSLTSGNISNSTSSGSSSSGTNFSISLGTDDDNGDDDDGSFVPLCPVELLSNRNRLSFQQEQSPGDPTQQSLSISSVESKINQQIEMKPSNGSPNSMESVFLAAAEAVIESRPLQSTDEREEENVTELYSTVTAALLRQRENPQRENNSNQEPPSSTLNGTDDDLSKLLIGSSATNITVGTSMPKPENHSLVDPKLRQSMAPISDSTTAIFGIPLSKPPGETKEKKKRVSLKEWDNT